MRWEYKFLHEKNLELCLTHDCKCYDSVNATSFCYIIHSYHLVFRLTCLGRVHILHTPSHLGCMTWNKLMFEGGECVEMGFHIAQAVLGTHCVFKDNREHLFLLPASYLPSARIRGMCHHTRLYVMLGVKPRASSILRKHSTYQTTSTDPKLFHLSHPNWQSTAKRAEVYR